MDRRKRRADPGGMELVLKRAAELPDETERPGQRQSFRTGDTVNFGWRRIWNNSGYRIDGMDEYDCFESLGYAG